MRRQRSRLAAARAARVRPLQVLEQDRARRRRRPPGGGRPAAARPAASGAEVERAPRAAAGRARRSRLAWSAAAAAASRPSAGRRGRSSRSTQRAAGARPASACALLPAVRASGAKRSRSASWCATSALERRSRSVAASSAGGQLEQQRLVEVVRLGRLAARRTSAGSGSAAPGRRPVPARPATVGRRRPRPRASSAIVWCWKSCRGRQPQARLAARGRRPGCSGSSRRPARRSCRATPTRSQRRAPRPRRRPAPASAGVRGAT